MVARVLPRGGETRCSTYDRTVTPAQAPGPRPSRSTIRRCTSAANSRGSSSTTGCSRKPSTRSNPLLERLKFVAIYETNLDEFFMIRVAAIKQQIEAQVVRRSDDGRMPAEHLSAISERLRTSLHTQMRLLNDDLLPALEREGIRMMRVSRSRRRNPSRARADVRRHRLSRC